MCGQLVALVSAVVKQLISGVNFLFLAFNYAIYYYIITQNTIYSTTNLLPIT